MRIGSKRDVTIQVDPTLLLAHSRRAVGPPWVGEAGTALRRRGWHVHRTHNGRETIARVEQGGLAAAVLVADQCDIDGMSLVTIIRSIDEQLPCWLVTESPTRQMLQQALTLRVTSVISKPTELDGLVIALQRLLSKMN